jgi:hexosaminidase
MSETIARFIEKELINGTSSKVTGLSGITSGQTVTGASTTTVTADELIDVQEAVADMYQAWKTVLGKLYLSHDQTIEGAEWNWAEVQKNFTQLTPEGKKNILGVSGQVWTETIKSPEMLEYYLFPKMLGYIERAWGGDPAWSEAKTEEEMKSKRQEEWNVFANLVGQREIPRLEKILGGLNQRLPKPGLMLKDGMIHANVQTPGLIIRYTRDGSEPTINSIIYSGPVSYSGGEKFRVFTSAGNAGQTAVLD